MPPDFQGSQEPRVYSVPEYVTTTGDEAVELSAMAGLDLDPWQQWCLRHSLGEREDGKWAASAVGLMVSRQNGKGSVLEARALVGLFLLGEQVIIHSAHEQATASEQFRRLLNLIQGVPELEKRLLRAPRGKGNEAIELRSGQRVFFKTRTSGGGRGFSADCLILDEAMILPDAFISATLPTLSSRPNPQVWYTGSAVDQEIHPDGLVFARVRERGIAGDDPHLFYAEWSVCDDLVDVTKAVADDPEAWAEANPAMGLRISTENIASERREFSTNLRGFAVERLGVGDWPRTDVAVDRFIDPEAWEACADPESEPTGDPIYAFDVTPDRAWAAICMAAVRDDGNYHVEICAHERGTSWIVPRLQELLAGNERAAVYGDTYGAARTLVPEFDRHRIPVVYLSAPDVTEACGVFYDAVVDTQTLRHLDDDALNAAVENANTRPVGGAWAWSRKSSAVDISPLVAVTIALWGAQTQTGNTVGVWDLAEVWAEKLERERKEEEEDQ